MDATGTERRKKKEIAMKPNHSQSANDSLITVSCNNYTTRDDLHSSWGFPCLIRQGGKNVHFDTGGDGIVLSENMGNLDLKRKISKVSPEFLSRIPKLLFLIFFHGYAQIQS